MEIMKEGHPDFIGFNYYSTATVEWDDGSGVEGSVDQQNGGSELGTRKHFMTQLHCLCLGKQHMMILLIQLFIFIGHTIQITGSDYFPWHLPVPIR